jgi:hypothetical protein
LGQMAFWRTARFDLRWSINAPCIGMPQPCVPMQGISLSVAQQTAQAPSRCFRTRVGSRGLLSEATWPTNRNFQLSLTSGGRDIGARPGRHFHSPACLSGAGRHPALLPTMIPSPKPTRCLLPKNSSRVCRGFSAGPVLAATKDRRTKDKLRWQPRHKATPIQNIGE